MATAPAPPPQPTESLDLAQLSATYIKIREAKLVRKHAWEAEEEAFDKKLEMIEGYMLRHLNQHGMESVRTEGGTFYKQESIKPNIVDDIAFFAWVKENDAFDALERRVKVGFIKDFAEAHEGGLPPGLNVSREWVIRVRKPQREVPADSFAFIAQPGSGWLVFYRNGEEYWRANADSVVSMETKRTPKGDV